MLTADLSLSWRKGNRTGPRLIEASDSRHLRVAADLIAIVSEHRGRRRAELDESLQEYVGVGTDYKVLRGLIKLITDRCAFETGGALEPTEARRALFLKARLNHPVTVNEDARRRVIEDAARELGCEPDLLLESLYADLPGNEKLTSFDEPDPAQLLDQYNLAQAQALLYRSVEMRLLVEPQDPAGYRQLFDAIKAYRLIHTVRGNPARGYEIRLTGPVSMFHRSQKYGVQMAVFLPALLACRSWRMEAEIDLKFGGTAVFELNSADSRLRSPVYDDSAGESPLIEKLITSWAKLESGWSIERSREILDLGEGAFIPDLCIADPQGEKVHMELIGFWTPRYLEGRLEAFERAGFKRFILAVSDELRGSREVPLKLPPNVITYKTTLSARMIQDLAEELIRPVTPPLP